MSMYTCAQCETSQSWNPLPDVCDDCHEQNQTELKK